MSPGREDLGPFYRDVIAVDPLEPYESASAAYRLAVQAWRRPIRCTPCGA
jgi:hypothetical protein